MFFVKVGSILAFVGFWLGVLRTGLGFFFAFGTDDMESNMAAARRYLATSNTGEAINEGMMLIAGSLVIGLLCRIAKGRDS